MKINNIILPLRDGVGIVVLNKENKVFVAKRIDNQKNLWQMPQGGVDKGENYLAAAYRELKEETNLTCSRENLVFLEEAKPDKFYFWAKKWNGDLNVLIPNPETGKIEHDDYRWASINDIKDIDNSEIPIYLLEKALDMSKNETDS